MSEPKIGDQVMCGPLTVADGPYVFGGVYVRECDAVDPTFCSDPVMLSTAYPWHEALPAVAAWLAEDEMNALYLVMALKHGPTWTNKCNEAVKPLIAALTEGV